MEPNSQPNIVPEQPEDEQLIVEGEQSPQQPYFNEEAFKQSEPTFKFDQSPAENTAFQPAESDNESMPEPITPLASSEPSIVEPTTVVPLTPSTVPTPEPVDASTFVSAVVIPKKKNRLWLWITLGISAVVVIALVASFLVMKNAGDAAARTYTASVKTYLDDVYDAATGAATDPADIKKAVEAIKVPVLESTLMGNLSGDYTSAKNLQTEVTSRVTALTTKIGGYAQVYSFYTDYTGLYSDLRVLDTQGTVAIATKSRSLISSYLKAFNKKLDEVNTLISNADSNVPSDFRSNLKDLGTVFAGMATNWSAMVSAFDSSNGSAYNTAFDGYLKANDGLTSAKSPIITYFNALSSKTHDAAKDLQTYRNTIK